MRSQYHYYVENIYIINNFNQSFTDRLKVVMLKNSWRISFISTFVNFSLVLANDNPSYLNDALSISSQRDHGMMNHMLRRMANTLDLSTVQKE